MRVVTQNVLSASLSIDSQEVAHIQRGLLWFVGFTLDDDGVTMQKMVEKIFLMRSLPDGQGKTNRSITDEQADLLVIPNFTLYGSIVGGRRPSFTKARKPDEASQLFQELKNEVLKRLPKAQFGVFGADMKITVVNDGPFTMVHDSKDLL